MSIGSTLISNQKVAVEIKSSAFNIPALILSSHSIVEIKQQLQKKILQAPEFFKNSPLLIELHELTEQQVEIDLRSLIKTLRSLHLIPIAVSGATRKQNSIAIELGIAVQTKHILIEPPVVEKIPAVEITEKIESTEPLTKTVSEIENKLITQPVRSGQRIYTKGDLTVLAPVNPGAELIAEGNIHIYAPMRGRALAGVQGNTKSCIFCSDLQAELVSIAGVYRLSEDFDKSLRQKLVQIYLHDQTLLIKKL